MKTFFAIGNNEFVNLFSVARVRNNTRTEEQEDEILLHTRTKREPRIVGEITLVMDNNTTVVINEPERIKAFLEAFKEISV